MALNLSFTLQLLTLIITKIKACVLKNKEQLVNFMLKMAGALKLKSFWANEKKRKPECSYFPLKEQMLLGSPAIIIFKVVVWKAEGSLPTFNLLAKSVFLHIVCLAMHMVYPQCQSVC